MNRQGFDRGGRIACLGLFLMALLSVQSLGQTNTLIAPEKPEDSGAAATSQESHLDKLLDMADKDVSQLSQVKVAGTTGSQSLDMPVSTVSREESTVGKSPAAVFVITNEMIRRSGAREIPEILRMAPGVDVARIDSNKWAVSIRGFNNQYANKLLVQIDGRAVYTPLYGGVYWDVQDVLLEDVERIEVIRGPGATVWGANAVNGVINIITKNSADTQGVFVEGGAGTYEKGFTSARYGGRISPDLSYRLYGKWFERGDGFSPDATAYDAWGQARGGFRVDWNPVPDDTVTFEGDCYNGYSGESDLFPDSVPPYVYLNQERAHVQGENALLRWRRVLDDNSDWTAWTYYDQTLRDWPISLFAEKRDTFDFDFQHHFPVGRRNDVIWGFGYRNTRAAISDTPPFFAYDPNHRSDDLFSCFLQDQITLYDDRWFLTVGSKFEQNNYTGFEIQPTVRLLWTPDKRHSIWSSVSRAVRTPAESEANIMALTPPISTNPLPTFPFLFGNPNLRSEELIAYEIGVREQTTERFSWDLAIFYNNYQKLIAYVPGEPYIEPGPLELVPSVAENVMRGITYGAELAVTYQLNPRWRIQSAYSLLFVDLNNEPDLPVNETLERSSPRNQYYVHSYWDLGNRCEFDLIGRYVDSLPNLGVPKYLVGDARFSWRARENMALSVVGRNLFNGTHPEFGADSINGTLRTEVQPEVYGQVTWRY